MYTRTPLAFFAVLLAIILPLGGCGTSAQGSREEGLQVWMIQADPLGRLQELFDAYAQVSGLAVRVETGVKSKETLKALGSSKPPDLIILPGNDLIGAYQQRDLLEPLDLWSEATGIDLNDIYPAALAQCRSSDGRLLCLPWGCEVEALLWNKELFQQAGLDPKQPPRTMEELAEYAGRLTVRDKEGEIDQIGFLPAFPYSHMDLYVRLFGGRWYTEDGVELQVDALPVAGAASWELGLYERQGLEAVRRIASSVDHHSNSRHPLYGGRRLGCQQCHTGAPPEKSPEQGFYTGKVAMMVGSQRQVGAEGIPHVEPGLDYGVAPFPAPKDHPEYNGTTTVQGPVVIIPAGAASKDEAIKLLAWMMSPEILAEAAYAGGRLPTSRAAAADQRLQRTPHFGLFIGLLDHPKAGGRSPTPIGRELNDALREFEAALLQGGEDPRSQLEKIQAELEPVLLKALAQRSEP